MRIIAGIAVAFTMLIAPVAAQEKKAVPSDSARVYVPGCTKGSIFTAGRRTVDEPGSGGVPVGTHVRMNGPKKMMAEIKAHEGQMIELQGLMKKDRLRTDGVAIGGGMRFAEAGRRQRRHRSRHQPELHRRRGVAADRRQLPSR